MKDKSTARIAVRLTAQMYLTRFLVLGTSLIANVCIARLLGPEGKGALATVLFWAIMLSSLSLCGMDGAALYFVGKMRARFQTLARFLIVYSAVAFAVNIGLLFFLRRWIPLLSGDRVFFWGTALLVWTYLLSGLFNALYTGFQKIPLINRVTVAAGISYMATAVILLVAGCANTHYMLTGIVAGNVVAAGFLPLYALRRNFASDTTVDRLPWREMARYAGGMYVGGLSGIAFTSGSFLILTLCCSIAEVGIYSAAKVFGDLLLVLPASLISIVLPRLMNMGEADRRLRVALLTRTSIAGAFVLCIITTLAGVLLVPWLFGSAFRPAAGMLAILGLAAWFSVAGTLVSLEFLATRKPGIPAAASWLGFAVVATLSLGLTPRWGGYGAAVAVCISRLVVSVWLLRWYVKQTGSRLASVLIPSRADWAGIVTLIREFLDGSLFRHTDREPAIHE